MLTRFLNEQEVEAFDVGFVKSNLNIWSVPNRGTKRQLGLNLTINSLS
jgi:hypothetical protein